MRAAASCQGSPRSPCVLMSSGFTAQTWVLVPRAAWRLARLHLAELDRPVKYRHGGGGHLLVYPAQDAPSLVAWYAQEPILHHNAITYDPITRDHRSRPEGWATAGRSCWTPLQRPEGSAASAQPQRGLPCLRLRACRVRSCPSNLVMGALGLQR